MVSWNITIGGNDYLVTVEPGENERYFVRVNGRVAAPSMAAGDDARSIVIDSMHYVVQRDGDSFVLLLDETTTTHYLSAERSRRIFLRFLGWSAVAGGVLLAFLFIRGVIYERSARARVGALLAEMKSGRESEQSLALWAGRQASEGDISWISDHFDHWRTERNLYKKRFTSYAVTYSRLLWNGLSPTALVSFDLDGVPYEVRVPKDLPISWQPGSGPMPQLTQKAAPPDPGFRKADGPIVEIKPTDKKPPSREPTEMPDWNVAKPPSAMTIYPRVNMASRSRGIGVIPSDYRIVITAADRRRWDGTATPPEKAIITYVSIESLPLSGGDYVKVYVDTADRPLSKGDFATGTNHPDWGHTDVRIQVGNYECMGKGALQILNVEYVVGEREYASAILDIFITRLDAKFTAGCGDNQQPLEGEIHLLADAPKRYVGAAAQGRSFHSP